MNDEITPSHDRVPSTDHLLVHFIDICKRSACEANDVGVEEVMITNVEDLTHLFYAERIASTYLLLLPRTLQIPPTLLTVRCDHSVPNDRKETQ